LIFNKQGLPRRTAERLLCAAGGTLPSGHPRQRMAPEAVRRLSPVACRASVADGLGRRRKKA
jgi:hypothetical protein